MRRILFCVAVSLAAALLRLEGAAAQDANDSDSGIETNTSVDVDEPETYAQRNRRGYATR